MEIRGWLGKKERGVCFTLEALEKQVSTIEYEANVCLTLALLAPHKAKKGYGKEEACGTFIFGGKNKKE
jgi:hypothetical protein